MTNSNSSPDPNFDPCGGDSPGGCSKCPHSSECYLGLEDLSLDDLESVHIVDADLTLRLSNGDIEEMPLAEFLAMVGFFDDDDWDEDDEPLPNTSQRITVDSDELIREIERLRIQTPVTVEAWPGHFFEIDKIGGIWHVGTKSEGDYWRHLNEIMNREDWGPEPESWDD